MPVPCDKNHRDYGTVASAEWALMSYDELGLTQRRAAANGLETPERQRTLL